VGQHLSCYRSSTGILGADCAAAVLPAQLMGEDKLLIALGSVSLPYQTTQNRAVVARSATTNADTGPLTMTEARVLQGDR
jgi:hypothetical protein